MENKIINVWEENAEEWIKLMNDNGISSRKVTNKAIVETLLRYPFKKVCDVGCGEGWLVRELRKNGKIANGVDGINKLIESAKSHDIGEFYTLTFEEIISGSLLSAGSYDALVLNFCIYESETTVNLLKILSQQLVGDKLIFIQSLHPFSIFKLNKPYDNQWLHDSWKGLRGDFKSTHSWYYRTFAGWQKLFIDANLEAIEIHEPTSTEGIPLSVIYVLKPKLDA